MRTCIVCATDLLKTNTRKLSVASGKYYYTWNWFGAPTRASNVPIIICRWVCSQPCILQCCVRVPLVFVCFPLFLFLGDPLQTSELISVVWHVGCWKSANRGKEVDAGWWGCWICWVVCKGSYCLLSLPGESAPSVHLHLQQFFPYYHCRYRIL